MTNFSCSCGFGPAALSSPPSCASSSAFFASSLSFLDASSFTLAHSRPSTYVSSSPGLRVTTIQFQRSACAAASCVPMSLSAPTPPFLKSWTDSTRSPCGGGAPPWKSGSGAGGSASSRIARTSEYSCSLPSSASTHGEACSCSLRKEPSGTSSACEPSSCSSSAASAPSSSTPSGIGKRLLEGPAPLPSPSARGMERKSATMSTLDAAPSPSHPPAFSPLPTGPALVSSSSSLQMPLMPVSRPSSGSSSRKRISLPKPPSPSSLIFSCRRPNFVSLRSS
mmetsp:Transcript_6734/g.22110  ORF Transcript_6734/g.22110 Transcript_6734/m.22110 type:complete len:280 (+) Transcript_6734:1206-2045(+)